ncbi:Glycosyltransferase involved in cell wall bisynthesis [Selenomonas sp. GACV-9]|uniref:glycosyltransferase family 4 protein n=1 Tax=Selenomonas sp. GACV-9 TaxID=3158782 RepID=UPI0008E519DA|nr:Glycosyltransferase involved in cell wall bisynthesis [Selenomonas ruminantium]
MENEKRLRVGVDVRMLKSSGIGKVIENVLTRMIPMRQDWFFYLIGKKDEIDDMSFSSNKNVHIIECDCPIYSIREQFVLPRIIPKDLDCFWSPHYNVPVFYKGKLIVTIHDLAHLALKKINKSILKRAYANIMFRLATYKASRIICVSQFTRQELIKYIPNVDVEKISVVYNGVNEKWKHIKREKSPHTKPYFVYVGNIKPHKNLHRLIEAYKTIIDDVEQDLILVGKKDGFITGADNIAEIIKGYENRIIFTGYVSDDLLMQYVANSDALVFPSLYEGFGLPPLEALAAEKRVIVSNVASIPEVCGDCADYFNPYDVNDIADKLKDEKRKINIDEWLCKFDWNDKVNEIMNIIEAICESDVKVMKG